MNKHNKTKTVVKERNLRGKGTVRFLDIHKSIFKYWLILVWLLGNRDVRANSLLLVKRIRCLYTTNGALFTVMYLKESHRLIMKALAGKPQCCEPPLRVATRRGLPLIIPGRLRILMENKNENSRVIKLVLSLITVYKVIKAPPKLDLSTITSPFKGISPRVLMEELKFLHESRFSGFQPPKPQDLKIWDLLGLKFKQGGHLLPLLSAGPNVRQASVGAILDAIALHEEPNLLEALRTVTSYTGPNLWELLKREASHFSSFKRKCELRLQSNREAGISGYDYWEVLFDLKLGRLAEKLEAAGKVRVFAICDIWTQSALRPFHDYIFQILKNIPQDGTFNQYSPIRRLLDQGFQDIYSYDLSAATDRLPVLLQRDIISLWIDSTFADAWHTLLVGRSWWHKDVPLLYAVGQPMGAYSSWGMLALTHHYIVQLAAMRAGWEVWFPHYAVLGDDIVIADTGVAKAYLSLMKSLGVDINLSKSLESTVGVAEFAKRLLDSKADYSAIGAKSVMGVLYSHSKLPSLFLDLTQKEGEVRHSSEIEDLFDSFPTELSLKGSGKNLLWSIIGPFGFIRGGVAPFLTETETISLSTNETQSLMDAFDFVLNQLIMRKYYSMKGESHKAYQEMIRGGKGSFYDGDRWVSFSRHTWQMTIPIEGLPSTDDIMSQVTYNIFDITKPVLVSWHDSLYAPTLEQVYKYIQDRISHLEAFVPQDNIYAWVNRDQVATANHFDLYRLVAARLWSKDPAIALKLVRWDSKQVKPEALDASGSDLGAETEDTQNTDWVGSWWDPVARKWEVFRKTVQKK